MLARDGVKMILRELFMRNVSVINDKNESEIPLIET